MHENQTQSAVKGGTAANATVTNRSTSAKVDEQVKDEQVVKKLPKQALKTKNETTTVTSTKPTEVVPVECASAATSTKSPLPEELPKKLHDLNATPSTEKTRDQIKAEREAKKQAKQAAKTAKATGVPKELGSTKSVENATATKSTAAVAEPVDDKKKPVLTKAERRALQESQRAAKAQAQAPKSSSVKLPASNKTIAKHAVTAENHTIVETANAISSVTTSPSLCVKPTKKSSDCTVRLFNHLETARTDCSLFVNNAQIHPSIARLGEQYAKRTIVGSNARCIAFLNALKMVIQDFETPPKKEFARSLELFIKNCVEHLQNCRPLAVSVTNAYKHIKHVLTQLPNDAPETDLKANVCHFIDTYLENQIDKAAQAINSSMQEKISNGDVILTFGCSSLIEYICEQAKWRKVDFRVVIVDSRPFCEGQELLRRLTAKEIPCTYLLINAVGFVMPEVTKVLLGAHALLSNGYVMARTGTAQVALVARSFNVPVLVCCETHKFSERFQTDAIVYNELGNPDDLILSADCCLKDWQTKHKMSPLNLMYDITPPELVTAVVTEVSILPCTSVPVILRIKPTEIGYYS